MKGFELKLWRLDMGWTQERCAEEFGIAHRTYQTWESKGELPRFVELTTRMLSIQQEWSAVTSVSLKRLSTIIRH